MFKRKHTAEAVPHNTIGQVGHGPTASNGPRYAVGAGLLAAASGAFAAIPEGVETALGSIGTDGAEMAGIILLAIVTVFAIKFLRRGL